MTTSTRFSKYYGSVRSWNIVILAGKNNSRRHSTTSLARMLYVVAETSYQVLEVLWFCDRDRVLTPSLKITVLTILVKKKYNDTFRGVYFFKRREKPFSQTLYSRTFSTIWMEPGVRLVLDRVPANPA